MKARTLIFILPFLLLYSCKTNNDQQIEKKILGSWTFLRAETVKKQRSDKLLPPPPLRKNHEQGYIFSENGICENKDGYFKKSEGHILYLGNTTKYQIENGNLKILDLTDSTWSSQKLYSIIRDTLTVQENDNVLAKYIGAKHKPISKENYDRIIVSSSGCYGSCPIVDISINNRGNILYFGRAYTIKNGICTSKITKEDYQKIQSKFDRANISNLKNEYQGSWTDDETVTVSFIKENRIVKTISDYGRTSPIELICAYTPVKYLYQQLQLSSFKTEGALLLLGSISFETTQQICHLAKSESFFLKSEIIKGKSYNQKFDEKYKIGYWNENDKREVVITDGRFYKFSDRTIDIGYNFLTQNKLIEKFRKKNEYE